MGKQMKKILLIDADSKIPNLALMKLSTYHKQKGNKVDFIRLNLPYYPYMKKEKYIVNTKFFKDVYDERYCSVIFEGNKQYIKGNNIVFGGTGVDLTTELPSEIENLECDYTLYPENDISYGFITRGCSRKCTFCKVPKKEGLIRKVNEIDDIVRHKKVKFLDNNILSYDKHKDVFKELIDKKIRCQFNQGLDIRLIDEENSDLLSQVKWFGNYLFAFDNWSYLKIVEKKIKLMPWRKDDMFRFFVYVHPDMPLSDTIRRINWLKENKCLSYMMRDIACFDSQYRDFYTDLNSWSNNPSCFKMQTFEQYLQNRHTNTSKRKEESWKLWSNNQ
jgi:hypothetical protein